MAAAGVDEKCSRGNWWTGGRDVQRNARHVIVECTHSASHRCWKLLQIVMSTMIVSAHVYMNKNKTRTVATVLGGCRSNHLYTIHYYYYFNLQVLSLPSSVTRPHQVPFSTPAPTHDTERGTFALTILCHHSHTLHEFHFIASNAVGATPVHYDDLLTTVSIQWSICKRGTRLEIAQDLINFNIELQQVHFVLMNYKNKILGSQYSIKRLK